MRAFKRSDAGEASGRSSASGYSVDGDAGGCHSGSDSGRRTSFGGVAKSVGSGVTRAANSVGSGVGKAATGVGAGVSNVGGMALSGVSNVGGKALTGVKGAGDFALTGVKGVGGLGIKGVKNVGDFGLGAVKGVMSSGKGFREFLLKGTIVELAVAVVVGMAFTDLVNAMVKSFITPLIAAIFRGVSFTDMYFEINSSRFLYGEAINALVVFLLVLAFTYFAIMRPLQHFTSMYYPNRAESKDCPRCLSDIPLGATRCKFCTADLQITAEQRELLEKLAEERLFSAKGLVSCAPCISVGKTAVKYGRCAGGAAVKMVRPGGSRATSDAAEMRVGEEGGAGEKGAPAAVGGGAAGAAAGGGDKGAAKGAAEGEGAGAGGERSVVVVVMDAAGTGPEAAGGSKSLSSPKPADAASAVALTIADGAAPGAALPTAAAVASGGGVVGGGAAGGEGEDGFGPLAQLPPRRTSSRAALSAPTSSFRLT